ncbi:winged helix-turn-helix transcriptional regulator [Eoetvoesiella caeni]
MNVSVKTKNPLAIQGGPTLLDKMRRGELLVEACPSREVLKHVTSRWGVLVLLVLQTGVHRFSELRRAIGGVSERMLAQTLQWLESDGLVERHAFEVVPPHVEYRLTPLGREAAEKVKGLADWIETSLPRILQAQDSQSRKSGRP